MQRGTIEQTKIHNLFTVEAMIRREGMVAQRTQVRVTCRGVSSETGHRVVRFLFF